jgi:hypothetical protein
LFLKSFHRCDELAHVVSSVLVRVRPDTGQVGGDCLEVKYPRLALSP